MISGFLAAILRMDRALSLYAVLFMVSAVIAVCCIVLWLENILRMNKNLPPGPCGLPLLGYLPFLKTNQHELFLQLSESYGPIISVRVGMTVIVVLNDMHSIRSMLTHDSLQCRLRNTFLKQVGLPGVGTLNGDAWRQNRQVSLRILKALGFGKPLLCDIVQDEVNDLLGKLQAIRNCPVLPRACTLSCIGNVITRLLLGVSYSQDHPIRRNLDNLNLKADVVLRNVSMVLLPPAWLYDLLCKVPFTGHCALKKCFGDTMSFIRKNVREREKDSHNGCCYSFIEAYLQEVAQRCNGCSTHIESRYLPGTVFSFLGAGTNAIGRSMAWHLLNCADKPITVQARIQKEVDEVVGPNRLPSWRDHYSMPFTMATIFEMHRWRPVLPMGLPRGAEDDIKVSGYVIPKGAIVMPNLWALSMDKGLWDNAELFDPSRFMDPGTGKLKQKPKYYIPFSVGKRMCPAEGVAQMEIFLLLTSILQHFSVCPAGDAAIDLSMNCRTFNYPKPQEIMFRPRYCCEQCT